MLRLIVQELRRHRLALVIYAFWAGPLWLRLADGTTSLPWTITLSMVVASFVRIPGFDQPRELLVLPLSHRQLRHLHWMFGTIIPVATLAAGKLIAMAIASYIVDTSSLRLSTVALSAVCDFAYLGVAYGVLLVPRIRAAGERPFDGTIDVLFLLVFFGSWFWGLFLAPYVPTQWVDLAGLRGVAVTIGLGIAAAGYFYSPVLRSPRFFVVPAADRRIAWTAPPQRFTAPAGGIVSLVRVVLGYCTIASLVAAVVLLKIGNPFTRLGREVFTAIWILMALVISLPNWSERLRQLRTLPIATRHLNALLLATPVAIWLSVWTTLAIVNAGFAGHIADAFQPELIGFLIGTSALTAAAWLQSRWLRLPLTSVPLVVLYFGLHQLHGGPVGTTWAASIAFGILALAAAAWLNHHALTRSSAIYKAERPALSFAR